jgi:hypothetical protein
MILATKNAINYIYIPLSSICEIGGLNNLIVTFASESDPNDIQIINVNFQVLNNWIKIEYIDSSTPNFNEVNLKEPFSRYIVSISSNNVNYWSEPLKVIS